MRLGRLAGVIQCWSRSGSPSAVHVIGLGKQIEGLDSDYSGHWIWLCAQLSRSLRAGQDLCRIRFGSAPNCPGRYVHIKICVKYIKRSRDRERLQGC